MSIIRFLFALWLLGASLPSYADCPDRFAVAPLVASVSDSIFASICTAYDIDSQSHSINGNVIDVFFAEYDTGFPAHGGVTIREDIGMLSVGIYTINIYHAFNSHQYVLVEQFTVQVNAPQASSDTSVPTLGEWAMSST